MCALTLNGIRSKALNLDRSVLWKTFLIGLCLSDGWLLKLFVVWLASQWCELAEVKCWHHFDTRVGRLKMTSNQQHLVMSGQFLTSSTPHSDVIDQSLFGQTDSTGGCLWKTSATSNHFSSMADRIIQWLVMETLLYSSIRFFYYRTGLTLAFTTPLICTTERHERCTVTCTGSETHTRQSSNSYLCLFCRCNLHKETILCQFYFCCSRHAFKQHHTVTHYYWEWYNNDRIVAVLVTRVCQSVPSRYAESIKI